jgi:hypothetical protein
MRHEWSLKTFLLIFSPNAEHFFAFTSNLKPYTLNLKPFLIVQQDRPVHGQRAALGDNQRIDVDLGDLGIGNA